MGLKGLALKGLVIVAVLLAVMPVPAAAYQAGTNGSAPSASSPAVSSPAPANAAEPHITVANPGPQALPWSLHEKIAWAANLVLAIMGYAGIMLALQTLKKIERQTGYTESAAEAAAASAHAALLNAQAIIHSERPWILVSVEPSRNVESSFTIMATNRGRTPAKIIESKDRAKIAIDEKHLPVIPDYGHEKPGSPLAPIILLPGESTPIKPFCRDDVKGLCDSEERFKRIETWEEKVFLYGKVVYKDLIASSDSQMHETDWCCWYIHGRQNSGLVIAGPQDYNSHT